MIYVFEKFELDVENFSLTRGAERVGLEPKALQVLTILVANPGKLLDKSVILDRVWGGTFVEESNLTRAVALIRKQLGDDARQPRFIETVPTRGYRFIGGVLARQETSAALTDDPVALPVQQGKDISDGTPSEVPQAYRSPRKTVPYVRRLVGFGALALAIITLCGWWLHVHRRISFQTKDTIVLADFTNTTGDPILDDTLRQGLAVQLEQSPVLRLLSDTQARSTLRLMGLSQDSPLTPRAADEVCQRTGSSVVLNGHVMKNGNQYVLGVEGVRCRSGEILLRAQKQVESKEDLLDALSVMATDLRARLGESQKTLHELDLPLAEATTPSLEALKVYSTAFRTLALEGSVAALPLFQRATEIDPDFAMAHSEIGRLYADVGEEELSLKSAETAYRLRMRSSLRERFFIDTNYQLQVLGNVEKAEETCQSWRQLYPRDPGATGFLAGIILRIEGRYDEALNYAGRTIETNPSFGMGYHLQAINQIRLNKFTEATQTLHKAAELGLTMPEYQMDGYRVAFLVNDTHAMRDAVLSAESHRGIQSMMMNQVAATLAFQDRTREADSFSEQAVELARHSGKFGMAANFEAAAALRSAFRGEEQQARERAHLALTIARTRDAQYGAAFAYALAGDKKMASSLADDLAKRFPEDTVVRYQYVPSIRGMIAVHESEPLKALEILKDTERYDLGFPQNAAVGTYGALYAPYVRGRAYVQLHRDSDAREAFRKILSHPGITLNDPIGAIARRQLAKL